MKDNKLIAEFMGKEIYQKYHESKYHCSWDWLMPVVQKCILKESRLAKNGFPVNTPLSKSGLSNMFVYDVRDFFTKEEAYKGVVEFIKWYNKNT